MRRGGPSFQGRPPQPASAPLAPPNMTTRVIWTVLLVAVIGLLFGFIFLLVRDVKRRDSKAEELDVTVDDLLDLYLRTPNEQLDFEKEYLKQKERRDPAPAGDAAQQGPRWDLCPPGLCNRPGNGNAGRRRRETGDELAQHGSRVARAGQASCCLSYPYFSAPTTLVNKYGAVRNVYHEPPYRYQYVTRELCSGGSRCGGCNCCQDYECISLMVRKPGGGIEIDYFSVESCCKCFF